MYKEGQRILERQRFQFPTSWLYSDNIEGEWGAFNDIMKRKDSSIQTQVASLQMKIVSEDKVVESKTTDLLSDWDKDKPVAVSSLSMMKKFICSSKLFWGVKKIISLCMLCNFGRYQNCFQLSLYGNSILLV
jgi:hypothetical protein